MNAWKEGAHKRVSERIANVRGAISIWHKNKHVNSREKIAAKKVELEEALTNPRNDTNLIHKISEELKKTYADEEAYWK